MLQGAFGTADTNQDGALSRQEVETFLNSRGIVYLEVTFAALSRNGESITLDDIQAWLDALPGPPTPDPACGCLKQAGAARGLQHWLGNLFLLGLVLAGLRILPGGKRPW